MDRRATRLLLGIVGLAVVVRFGTLGAKGFWGDELSTLDLVRRPLGDTLAGVAREESTPPLYYVVTWAWAQAVPTTEVGLRALTALCGVALAPVSYWAAREVASVRAAAIAAALVACNPFLVWYSQEARSYSLLTLLSAVALLCFLRALRRPGRGAYAGWALASALALATHYFAVFLALPEGILLLRAARGRRAAAAAVGAVAAAGALLLPLALHQRSLGHAEWIGHSSLLGRVAATPFDFVVGFDAPSAALPLAALALAAGLVGLVRFGRVPESPSLRVVGGLALAGVALPLALGVLGIDYFHPRNVMPALVPALIVLAAGFAARARWRLGLTAGGALCVSSLAIVALTAAEPKFHSEDWRAAARELGQARVDRLVVATPGQAARKPLEFYLPGSRKLRPAGRPVSEVDVLALPRQGSTQPIPVLGLSKASFRLVDRDRDGRFVLWRYRAPAQLWVAPSDAGLPAVPAARAVVIWQPSSTRARPPAPVD